MIKAYKVDYNTYDDLGDCVKLVKYFKDHYLATDFVMLNSSNMVYHMISEIELCEAIFETYL